MFFEQVDEIGKIAEKIGCAVFVVPKDTSVELAHALILSPDEKSIITIDQTREVLTRLNVKQTAEQFVLIRPADALSEEAANAILKNLEEPGDKVHFVLVTESPSRLLPTILSRSAIYFLKTIPQIKTGVAADEKVKDMAKRLMIAREGELVAIAEEIGKKKDGVRGYALEVLAAAIEMSYKTYFLTGKIVFVSKLPKFLQAYKNIEQNGNVKLHLVADLI